jgi:hypothetical protein
MGLNKLIIPEYSIILSQYKRLGKDGFCRLWKEKLDKKATGAIITDNKSLNFIKQKIAEFNNKNN